jgi:hypothetical protein
MVVTAAALLALAGPCPAAAEETSGEDCAPYVEAMELAREALEKGDRRAAVVLLKRAQSELQLCLHRSQESGANPVG